MLTSHKIKIIKSLDKKKFRQKYNLFLVESNKIIKELANSHVKILEIYSVKPEELKSLFKNVDIFEIDERELRKISFLQNPKDSVAVCSLETAKIDDSIDRQIILDGIQDPGNLGTIIRLADWFGIEQVVCSQDTVDLYNPKVLMSTMGSFARVNVCYVELEDYLKIYQHPIIGTDMQGESIYKKEFPSKFSLVLGNEGNGIRPSVEQLLTDVITIPRFGKQQSTESLNVSMATGIILGQIFSDEV
ncbi:RNA methyltransferase [Soonwooa sp.]|uniref:TrmH family RNA methyltransferase n=1 Tax=Soonwooa sp. TaxID=1938592 RepID=UPI0028A998AF|nr:RNA methyltransferase [Soonwooa sp.]